MPPLSIPVLGAMVPAESGWEPLGWDEVAQGPVPDRLLCKASLIGISGLTPSRERASILAERARIDYELPVIVGGPDIYGRFADEGPNLLLQEVDAICPSQMSKRLMAEILRDAGNERLEGIYSLQTGEPPDSVIPRRDLLPAKGYFAPNAIRSSSGCHLKCAWCTVGGRGFYPTPMDVLEADLASLKGWFFLDTADSFGSHPALLDGVLPLYKKSGMKWGTEATVADLMKEHAGHQPLIADMANAGCKIIYVGIESISRQLRLKKSSREQAEELIKCAHSVGIIVIGSFILDFNGDETAEEIAEMVDWASYHVDFAQFSLTALLPGCDLRRQAIENGNTIPSDPKLFDGAHATAMHRNFTFSERNELLRQAYVEFSRFKHIWRRTWQAPRSFAWLVFIASLRYKKGIPS